MADLIAEYPAEMTFCLHISLDTYIREIYEGLNVYVFFIFLIL